MSFEKMAYPVLGAGLGYRQHLAAYLVGRAHSSEWVELIGDHFIPAGAPIARNRLREIVQTLPCVVHALNMSIAAQESEDVGYIAELRQVANAVGAPWVSDHLALSRTSLVDLGGFFVPYRSRDVAVAIANKAARIQDTLERLLLLENVATILDPGGDLSEPDFINTVVQTANCGLLLDLTNMYYGCLNSGTDPFSYLQQLDLEHVVQVHLAGGRLMKGRFRDTHDQPVPDGVWELLEHLLTLTQVNAVLIERDDNFPEDLDELDAEVRKAKALLGRVPVHSPPPTSDRPKAAGMVNLAVRNQSEIEAALVAVLGNGGSNLDVGWALSEALRENTAKRLRGLQECLPAATRWLQIVGKATEPFEARFGKCYPRVLREERTYGKRLTEVSRLAHYLTLHTSMDGDQRVAFRELVHFEASLVKLNMWQDAASDDGTGRLASLEPRPRAQVDELAASGLRVTVGPHALLIRSSYDVLAVYQQLKSRKILTCEQLSAALVGSPSALGLVAGASADTVRIFRLSKETWDLMSACLIAGHWRRASGHLARNVLPGRGVPTRDDNAVLAMLSAASERGIVVLETLMDAAR